ncbi:MAG: AAA family ATPase [Antricoccus sp.]
MPDIGLTLTARLTGAALDVRRGIVRMHRDVMAALDLSAWDPVRLTGKRESGAIVAEGGADVPPGILVADDLTLGNLGLIDGTAVQVAATPLIEARSIELAGDETLTRTISPDMLRRAILGKIVTAGDNISLLPQDRAVNNYLTPAELESTRRALRSAMGMGYTTTLVTVTRVDATGPLLVTAGTAVSWRGGSSAPGWPGTTGSAGSSSGLFTVSPATRAKLFEPAADARSGAPGTDQQVQAQTKAQAAAVPAQIIAQAAETAQRTISEESPQLDELPGVKVQANSLKEWLDLGFHHTDVLDRLGSKPQLGILLGGPPGVGKRTMVRTVARNVSASVVELSAPSVAAVEAGSAATALREAVTAAAQQAPAILLIQDVEALAPRDDPQPLSRIFIDLIAHTIDTGKVAVVCTTARPEEVSTELLRPGVLDHQLSIPLPDRNGRQAILEAITKPVPLASDVHLDEIASRTPGFVTADLIALRREGSVRAALRQRDSDNPTISHADLIGALDVVRPTAMAESSLEVARVTLDDVGDMVEVKEALTEAVLWPLQYPDTFERLGISPPRGVLLYGPPGCGKTYLVKAIAGSGQTNVMSVKGAELLNKWVGESERAVRELFRRARQASPTLIFMDEIDALAPPRGQGTDGGTTDRVVASLLTELDGVESLKNVVVIGATNRPDLVDPALLRPGRLDRLIYVPPPDADGRAEILKAAARNTPITRGVNLVALAKDLDGYSSADCAALVREAALVAMRRDMNAPRVTKTDFDRARKNIRPSLNQDQVDWLANYAKEREKA